MMTLTRYLAPLALAAAVVAAPAPRARVASGQGLPALVPGPVAAGVARAFLAAYGRADQARESALLTPRLRALAARTSVPALLGVQNAPLGVSLTPTTPAVGSDGAYTDVHATLRFASGGVADTLRVAPTAGGARIDVLLTPVRPGLPQPPSVARAEAVARAFLAAVRRADRAVALALMSPRLRAANARLSVAAMLGLPRLTPAVVVLGAQGTASSDGPYTAVTVETRPLARGVVTGELRIVSAPGSPRVDAVAHQVVTWTAGQG